MDSYLRRLYRTVDRLDERLILSNVQGLSPRVRMACRFLEHRFSEGISLAEAARHVNMHPASLCRKMQQELMQHGLHITITDYLTVLRVRKAKELFQTTPFVLCKEVASLVGTSERNLERMFKRHAGKTPSEYRKTADEE